MRMDQVPGFDHHDKKVLFNLAQSSVLVAALPLKLC